MTLLRELSAATKAGKRRVAREESAKAQAEEKKKAENFTAARDRARLHDFPEAKKAMREEAQKGERTLSYSIAQFERSLSDYDWARAETLVDLLKAEGLHAATKTTDYEPFGSDPYYPYSATHLDVSISW